MMERQKLRDHKVDAIISGNSSYPRWYVHKQKSHLRTVPGKIHQHFALKGTLGILARGTRMAACCVCLAAFAQSSISSVMHIGVSEVRQKSQKVSTVSSNYYDVFTHRRIGMNTCNKQEFTWYSQYPVLVYQALQSAVRNIRRRYIISISFLKIERNRRVYHSYSGMFFGFAVSYCHT